MFHVHYNRETSLTVHGDLSFGVGYSGYVKFAIIQRRRGVIAKRPGTFAARHSTCHVTHVSPLKVVTIAL